ncbi:MAG TPA: COX15/CtaA family protein [Terriglobales bacterium]|nr:COX15/CtaA family protein [Terriglobales bacterium]
MTALSSPAKASPVQAQFNKGLHRFATVLAWCVLLLIIAGALVTSNDAGLAVPDWPTSFGSLYKIPPMVGGVKYEHGHRMIAQFIGLLTIILAVWTQRVEKRSWMRKLGWVALGLVIAQGVLGGLTVLNMLPWYISTGHALLAQSFFALTLLFSLFTSRKWMETEERGVIATGTFNLRVLSILSVGMIYVQLFLGAAFRHGGMHFLPHIIGAVLVTAILLWTAIKGLSSYSAVPEIKRPAIGILSMLFVQLALGFGAYLTRVEWGRDAVQPQVSMVVTTVAHVAVGAVLLGKTFVLAVQAHRHIQARDSATVTA